MSQPSSTSSATTTPSISYAQKLQNKIIPITEISHPDDEQGFFFEPILDYKQRDYLIAMKDLVNGPQNIIAISPIGKNRNGKNRTAIHLKSKELLNEFMQNHGGFQIESNFIKCMRLKSSPLTKVVLSHVNPSIPNTILNQFIINELKLDIKIPISFLRLNPHDQLFAHVLTWRRQFHTDTIIEKQKLPQSFLIDHNGQKHRIFITIGDSTCYKCHKEGHRAENCPISEDVEIEEISSVIQESIVTQEEFPPLPTQKTTTSDIPLDNAITPEISPENANTSKSPPTPPTPPPQKQSISISEIPPHDAPEKTNPSKKMKLQSAEKNTTKLKPEITAHQTEQKKSLKEIFRPLKENFEKHTCSYPIGNLNNFSIYIDMCNNKTDIVALTKEYTLDLKGVIQMLEENYPLLEDRSTKIKFTKIINKLQQALSDDTAETQ
ncbi:hypothetical protein U1Q18_046558 [Sarracenia purpurea var. burkii]